MARHVCGIECIKLKKGRLYHACTKCKHKTETPIARSKFGAGAVRKLGSRGHRPSKPVWQMNDHEYRRELARAARNVKASSIKRYKKLTGPQQICAARYVPEMVHEFKKGRWKSRGQAIAVGLSKARSCGGRR
jgi:hypothetical protein